MWHNVPAYNQTCWERKNKQTITKDMEKQQQQIDDSCKTQNEELDAGFGP